MSIDGLRSRIRSMRDDPDGQRALLAALDVVEAGHAYRLAPAERDYRERGALWDALHAFDAALAGRKEET